MLQDEIFSVRDQGSFFSQENLESLNSSSGPSSTMDRDSEWCFENDQWPEKEQPAPLPCESPPAGGGGGGGSEAAAQAVPDVTGHEAAAADQPCHGYAEPPPVTLKDLLAQSMVAVDPVGEGLWLDDVLTGPDDPVACASYFSGLNSEPPLASRSSDPRNNLAAPGQAVEGAGHESAGVEVQVAESPTPATSTVAQANAVATEMRKSESEAEEG